MTTKTKFLNAIALIALFLVTTPIEAYQPGDPMCMTYCDASESCEVVFIQTDTNWDMNMDCGDGLIDVAEGQGDFTGTICDGVETCNVPMIN
ncbi:MAG: hypothetical protein U5K31_09910 [Balneolaceae bacterium]|nr:hypothetical protein [Balneolaceae bacterium]